MSFQALAWAANQRTKRSSDKLVLLAIADRHNTEQDAAWPSVAWLVDFTSLDRKTVLTSVARLVADGYLKDTGERQGRTTQVKVYRLLFDRPADFQPTSDVRHYVYRLTDAATGRFYLGVRSFDGDPEQDTYRGSGVWPGGMKFNGVKLDREVLAIFADRAVAEQAEAAMIAAARANPLCMNLAGNSPKIKSPVFPKQSQNSHGEREKRDTEPVNEPISQKATPSSRARAKPVSKGPLPEGWEPEPFKSDSKCAKIMAGWDKDKLAIELEKFWANHLARDTRFSSWQQAWATWVLNSINFGGHRHAKPDHDARQRDARDGFERALDRSIAGGDDCAAHQAADDQRRASNVTRLPSRAHPRLSGL